MPAEPPNRVTVTLWISEPSSSNASSGQQQSSANWASSSTHLQQQQQQAGNDGAGATSSTPSTQADTEDVDEDTDSSGSYSWGVPLTTFYAPEITLNRDLQKAEQLGLVEHGDILEIFKAPSSGNNDQTRINALTPSPDHVMLVRVTRQCWTPEGASTQLQVSVSSGMATPLSLKNRDQIVVGRIAKPIPKEYIADHVELYFKDQYLGRADMHRLSLALANTCVYLGQKVQLAGLNIRASIGGIWVAGKPRKSALVSSDTRTVFRSESAKYYIFVQLSREMWFFDDDGSLFFEKVVDLFLPELFSRWEKRSTNHIVSLVLFSRIIYDSTEVAIVDRPVLGADKKKGGFSDVYKVLIDLESKVSWPDVLRKLRQDFHEFRQEVLLRSAPRPDGKQAGVISAAHEGGVLEAINMALSAFDKHYVDRDLQRTGLSIVIVTAGTSHFHVDKNLLRLTMERMVDEGIGVDLVSLAKMPLHAVPLFRYDGTAPTLKEGRATDFLYVEDSDVPSVAKEALYAIPHWIDSSFYAKHQDKPFRQDRFLPRCRMPAVQHIGKAEYENAGISIPSLNPELDQIERYLSRTSRDWQELSEREKRARIFDRYDEIACGALGKWESLEEVKSWLDITRQNNPLHQIRNSGSLSNSSSRSSRLSSTDSGTGSHTAENSVATVARKQPDARKTLETPVRSAKDLDVRPGTQRPQPDVTADHFQYETPTTSPVKPSLSGQTGLHMASRATSSERKPAESVVSSSTLSRRSSVLALRSQSTVGTSTPPTSTNSTATAAPSARRLVSSTSTSSATAVEASQIGRAGPPGGVSTALASLLATQARISGSSASKKTGSDIGRSTSWFWSRKAKPAQPQSQVSPITATSSPNKTRDQSSNDEDVFGVSDKAFQKNSPQTQRKSAAMSPSDLSSASPVPNISKTQPIASLSITPATPAAAETTSGTSDGIKLSTSVSTQPIRIGPIPSQFTVATNDTLSDPKSLEEHSLNQVFLHAAQASSQNRAARRRMEEARNRKLEMLNPSNPSRSSSMLQDQSRRWVNIFPRAGRVNNQRSVKWKSLCTPACLPLYSDYMPSTQQLSTSYIKESYSLPVRSDSFSFMFRSDSRPGKTVGNLIRELVSQRLAQSFQILMPAYDDVRRERRVHRNLQSQTGSDEITLPSARDIREILFNTPRGEGKAIYLGFSNIIHRLSFTIWPVASSHSITRSVHFSYPNLTEYDWKYNDRLVAGLEEAKLDERTRYWRTRFILVPTEVPDLRGMIASQNRILLEDSTEDDLKIAGVMTIYEQFSKARWVPPPRESGRIKLQPLSYSTTVLDPSLTAAAEAERLTGESAEVPLPEAYAEELFFEDMTFQEVARAMLEGPRPLKMQSRRRGFRVIEESFTGEEFVTWLVSEFVDIPSRTVAIERGNDMLQAGHLNAINPPKRLLDNYSFYTLAAQYRRTPKKRSHAPLGTSVSSFNGPSHDSYEHSVTPRSASYSLPSPGISYSSSGGGTNGSDQPARYTEDGRIVVPMSHCIVINLDAQKRSDRSETAFLHFDVAHNTSNGFHFQLNWLGTARLVEDMLSYWQRNAEKYGLKLVEENVRQIKDIAADNPLQNAEQIRLVLPPPNLPDLPELLGPAIVARDYFETQLLKSQGFILDIEADDNFPPNIEAEYSYRKTPFEFTQFIHRSGTCFVQCLGGEEGFLFLKNRLFLSHRSSSNNNNSSSSSSSSANAGGGSSSHQSGGRAQGGGGGGGGSGGGAKYANSIEDPSALKEQLKGICRDRDELRARWDEYLGNVHAARSKTVNALVDMAEDEEEDEEGGEEEGMVQQQDVDDDDDKEDQEGGHGEVEAVVND